MNWNIADLLPESANCRNSFYAVIAGYISSIYNRIKSKEQDVNSTVTSIQIKFGLCNELDIEYTKKLLTEEISQTLFQ